MLKQKYPQESAAQLAQRLIASADDAGATGRDPLYGYGVFNPQDAMALPAPKVTANPLGSISEWIAVHRKQQVSEPTPSDAAPVHEEGESDCEGSCTGCASSSGGSWLVAAGDFGGFDAVADDYYGWFGASFAQAACKCG